MKHHCEIIRHNAFVLSLRLDNGVYVISKLLDWQDRDSDELFLVYAHEKLGIIQKTKTECTITEVFSFDDLGDLLV